MVAVADRSLADEIMNLVTRHYLQSADFNGLPVSELAVDLGVPYKSVISAIAKLVAVGRLTLAFEKTDLNPLIRRLPAAPIRVQLDLLHSGRGGMACAYPTSADLDHHVSQAQRLSTPYAARLMAGEPQLQPVFFDPVVLDRYMRDPRFWVDFSDYTGSINTKSDPFLDKSFPKRDKISLQTFGIGYRPNGLRVVVVFLRYLADLTPEHQRLWQASEVTEDCRIIGDYLRNAFDGDFAESISVYEALLQEQVAVNQLTVAGGLPPFFRRTFVEERPSAYHPLLVPTLRAYLEFVGVLDKLLSENINLEFFPAEMRVKDKSGHRKASLSLLQEWLRSNWRPRGEDPIPLLLGNLRKVRQERQRPAHQIEPDRYDIALYEAQRALIRDAWSAMNMLRQIFANLSGVGDVELPSALDLPVNAY